MPISSVVVSAPAKIILFGEHAVVYGQPALVAALGRRLRLSAARLPSAGLRLILPDLHAAPISLTAADLNAFFTVAADISSPVFSQWLSTLPVPAPARDTVAALLLVFAHDGRLPFPGLQLRVDSSIPVGAGLGSSAALSVSAAAARLLLDGDLPLNTDAWTAQHREKVCSLSLCAERLFHGRPSGLDSAVATTGGVVAFSRVAGVRAVTSSRRLQLLVVDTGVARSTADMVDGVRRRSAADPAVYERLFAAVGDMVRRAEERLGGGDDEGMGELVRENQRLLREMGVSHTAVEEVVTALEEGGVAAKLTGAGGGGCVIGVISNDCRDVEAVMERVKERGYSVWECGVGVEEGVRVEEVQKE